MEEYITEWQEERVLAWMTGLFLRLPPPPFSFLQPVGGEEVTRGICNAPHVAPMCILHILASHTHLG